MTDSCSDVLVVITVLMLRCRLCDYFSKVDSCKQEEEIVCSVRPEEIPEIPTNNFLRRGGSIDKVVEQRGVR